MMTGHVIYGVGSRRRYSCRPLDEAALFRQGADPDRLMAQALLPDEHQLGAGDLPDLPLVDYELMLAHLCADTFGEMVGQNIDCAECGKKFSLEFSLPAWIRELRDAVAPERAATFDGAPVALPTRAILHSVARDRGALARRLWRGDADLPTERMEALEAHLARACPLLKDDIEAPCPRCGETAHKQFTLRAYLDARLRAWLRGLLSDIHALASSYHWTAEDILGLPRQTRSALVDTIRLHAQRRRATVRG